MRLSQHHSEIKYGEWGHECDLTTVQGCVKLMYCWIKISNIVVLRYNIVEAIFSPLVLPLINIITMFWCDSHNYMGR